MSTVITAIYEQGVLRPLAPLYLPEHARVEIQIDVQSTATESDRERVRAALRAAGLLGDAPAADQIEPVSDEQLAAAARELGAAGPLSDVVIADRDER